MTRRILVFLVTLILLTCATVVDVSTLPASATVTQDRGNPDIKVWVDTAYGFYHCPGSKLYGATKQGVYMTQKQAQDRGYRPAVAVCKS